MGKKLLAVLVGIGLMGFVVGTVMASAGSDITTPRTIRFAAKTTQFTQVDVKPAGFSQGDQLVFHDVLRHSGKTIGYDGGTCTVTSLVAAEPAQLQCVVTFVFGSGQVTTQGLLSVSDPNNFTGRFAVNGGTGIYQNARGQGTIHQVSSSLAFITLRLIP